MEAKRETNGYADSPAERPTVRTVAAQRSSEPKTEVSPSTSRLGGCVEQLGFACGASSDLWDSKGKSVHCAVYENFMRPSLLTESSTIFMQPFEHLMKIQSFSCKKTFQIVEQPRPGATLRTLAQKVSHKPTICMIGILTVATIIQLHS